VRLSIQLSRPVDEVDLASIIVEAGGVVILTDPTALEVNSLQLGCYVVVMYGLTWQQQGKSFLYFFVFKMSSF
jgi:hypothetical protein